MSRFAIIPAPSFAVDPSDTAGQLALTALFTAWLIAIPAAARTVKSTDTRPQLLVATLIPLAALAYRGLTEAPLQNDELTWHVQGLRGQEYLLGHTNTPPAYVEGKEGYIWVLGTVYAAPGPLPALGVLLNLPLMAVIVLATARTTEIINGEHNTATASRTVPAAQVAAWIVALSPSVLFWVPQLLRETLCGALVALTLCCAVSYVKTHTLVVAVVAIGALSLLAFVRSTVAIGVLLGIAAAGSLVRPIQSRFSGAIRILSVAACVWLAVRAWQFVDDRVGLSAEEVALRNNELRETASSGYSSGITPASSYIEIVVSNLPRSLFGPFIWEFEPTAVMFLAFIEGAFWISAATLAIAYLLRRQPVSVLQTRTGALFCVCLALAIIAMLSVSVANYGLLSRLRPMAYIAILPLAAIGLRDILSRAPTISADTRYA